MNELEQIKELIEKEIRLSGDTLCDWDEGFDAGLRFAMNMIKSVEEKNRVRG